MSGITWLHVSDWHQKGKEFDREVVRDFLMRDISERSKIAPNLDKIDFIIFSGDLAYHGKAVEYEAAIEHFFSPLLDATGLGDAGRERLFIVPGNHDVDRNNFDVLPNDLLERLNTPEAVADWLTDDRRRSALLGPLTDYSNFISDYLGGYQDLTNQDLAYSSAKRLTIDNRLVSVLCLNSTWLTGRNKDAKGEVNDYGHLILGEPQIHAALAQSREADIRIAVLHHPFEWLNQFDRNRIEERLNSECHFILYGHQHLPQVKVIKGPSGDVVYIPAGASYDRRIPAEPRYANSYNFIHLDISNGTGTIYLRRWCDRRTQWIADSDVVDGGAYQFKLPKNLSRAEPPEGSSTVSPAPVNIPVTPVFTPFKQFEKDLRDWLKVCSHQPEQHSQYSEGSFEFITNEPITGGYDRILIYGVEGESTIAHVNKLQEKVDKYRTHRGWLISMRRITPAARTAAQKDERLYCYTFDELVDQKANFDKYFTWLEEEVKRRGVDKFYVELACSKDDIDPETGEKLDTSYYERVDDYIGQWLDDPSAEHISILGEFGTGKTWLCLNYAYQAMKAYRTAQRAGRQRPRLPIVIQLRDFAKAMEVETLFSDFFFRKFEIGLPGYSAYQQLNRMGKLLLIFDGFDEMADRTNRQKQVDNFWQLARAVGPGAKAILTCRAEHFEFAKAAVRTFSGEETPTVSPEPTVLLEPPKFEILNLEKLSSGQISQIIIKREGEKGRDLATRILSIPALADLAQRAGFIEYIIAALPSLYGKDRIDLARIYLYATRELLLKNIKEKRSFTSMADKVHFLCELAWQMLSTNELKLNFTQFPDTLRRYRPELKEREVDHWRFDLSGQSLLVRDDDGNYSFSHKSLIEFFVAYKFAAELGLFTGHSEWIISYFSQRLASESTRPRSWHDFLTCPNLEEVCGEYINEKKVVQGCKAPGGTCISSFKTEPFKNIVSTFGQRPLSPEVLVFLDDMVEELAPLWDVINSTRGSSFDEVAYSGGNAATLLNRRGQSFAKLDLKGVVIASADLTEADLSEANLRVSNLQGATLNNSILDRADFRGCDLTGVTIKEFASIRSMAWSPDNQTLAVVGEDNQLHLWDTPNQESWISVPWGKKQLWDISWSKHRNRIYGSCRGGVGWIEVDKGFQYSHMSFAGRVSFIRIHPNDQFIALKRVETISRYQSFNEVLLWNLSNDSIKAIVSVRGYTNFPTTLQFSPNEEFVYVGRYNGNLQCFDMYGQKVAARHVFHMASLTALAVSSDNLVICGSRDGEVKFYSKQLREKSLSLPNRSRDKILQVEFQPQTGYFAIIDQAGRLDLWTPEAKLIISLSSTTHRWKSMTFNNVGTLLAVSSGPAIHVFDVDQSSHSFGQCLYKVGQTMRCFDSLISGAKGLDVPAPNGKGTLLEWLVEQGASLGYNAQKDLFSKISIDQAEH